MTLAGLFTEPRSPQSRRVHELVVRHAELVAESRDAARAAQVARAQREQLARELGDVEARVHAFRNDDGAALVKAAKEKVGRVERRLARHAEEERRARAAAELVDEALRDYTAANAGALESEVREDAGQAHARVQAAVRELAEAVGEFQQTAARHETLVRLTDVVRYRAQRPAALPDELVRAAAVDASALAPPLLLPPEAVIGSQAAA